MKRKHAVNDWTQRNAEESIEAAYRRLVQAGEQFDIIGPTGDIVSWVRGLCRDFELLDRWLCAGGNRPTPWLVWTDGDELLAEERIDEVEQEKDREMEQEKERLETCFDDEKAHLQDVWTQEREELEERIRELEEKIRNHIV